MANEKPPFDLKGFKFRQTGELLPTPTSVGEMDTEFERIIGLDNKYHYSEGDTDKARETRSNLLEGVSVTDRGVAICKTDNTTTRVIAFRVENNRAHHVPFVEGENNEVLLPLPAETGSQIGFFIEDANTDSTSSAGLRQGEYPGIPLATGPFKRRSELDGTIVEVAGERGEMIAIMGGLKDMDAPLWASDIHLTTKLAFNPNRTRELLGMRYVKDSKRGEDTVTNRRLLVLPEHMRDLAGHFDAMDVARDLFQILTFANTDPKTQPKANIEINPHMYENPLGIGLGNPYVTKEQQTKRDDGIGEMRSAFQVRVVPQSELSQEEIRGQEKRDAMHTQITGMLDEYDLTASDKKIVADAITAPWMVDTKQEPVQILRDADSQYTLPEDIFSLTEIVQQEMPEVFEPGEPTPDELVKMRKKVTNVSLVRSLRGNVKNMPARLIAAHIVEEPAFIQMINSQR